MCEGEGERYNSGHPAVSDETVNQRPEMRPVVLFIAWSACQALGQEPGQHNLLIDSLLRTSLCLCFTEKAIFTPSVFLISKIVSQSIRLCKIIFSLIPYRHRYCFNCIEMKF